MPDRECELERELRELGSLIDYPPTPDVAHTARTLLDREANDRPRRFWATLPALRWAAVAATFVLIVAVPILSPGLRATVGDWFVAENSQGVGGPALDAGSSERQQEANAPAAGTSKGGEAVTAPTRNPRFAGDRITLRQAQARMEGALLLPRALKLGKPDEVYAGGTPRKHGVVLVYRSGLPPLGDTGISLILTEVSGDIEPAYLAGKTAFRWKLARVMVDGHPGYWSPAGSLPSSMDRPLPGHVLLWEKGGVALRLEADLPKKQAIRLAESVS
jgi:hypothetical protein